MKCVIMAGGMGTRARPFTDYFPKAMMPAGDRPIIEHITGHLESSGEISEIIILADLAGAGAQIAHHYARHTGKPITFIQDSGSGTGGDLRHLDLSGEGEFLLWFSDNLCALDVGEMAARYHSSGADACIATRSRRREETGFAEVSAHMVTRFQEKPVLDLPSQQCLGIYILGSRVLGMVRSRTGPLNLSYDILQRLPDAGGISSYDIGDEPWLDAESPGILDRNSDIVSEIISRMGRPRPPRRRQSGSRAGGSGLSRRGPPSA